MDVEKYYIQYHRQHDKAQKSGQKVFHNINLKDKYFN